MQRTMPHFGKRLLAAATAAVLAFSVCVIPTKSALATDAMDVSGYVTATATPMRIADPQILGLSTVDERWSIEDGVTYDELTNTSGGLRYLLMGTTEYNENPDPYIYNTVYDTDGVKIIQDSTRTGYSSSQGMRALAPYGTSDSVDAIWEMLPDVIIGTLMDNNETTDYTTEARGVEEALGLEANSYNPIGVANNQQDTIAFLYELAEAANAAAENTGKSLRYGDAVELAKNYEKFVKGSQGYVLEQLAADNAEKKSVVLIAANDENGTVTLETGMSSSYLSIVSEVATNFADTLTSDESISITVEQLESYVNAGEIDLIMLASDDDYGDDFVSTTGLESMLSKIYWTLDQDCGGICADNRGADVARNYALILGCLYPEYIDQSDWIAYYYDTVYHVNDDMIAEAIDRAMDGVRNWDVTTGDASAYVLWTEDTVADYSRTEVAALIEEGVSYIRSLGSSVSDTLALTDYIAEEESTTTTSFTDVNADEWYAAAIAFVAQEGIMTGYTDGTGNFGVGDELTRAQMARIMYNYAASNGEDVTAASDSNTTGLSDLDDVDWYTQACNWAYANGVMTGYDDVGLFAPNQPITLQELVQVLANYFATDEEIAAADVSALYAYPDGDQISEWAIPAMAWGLEVGLYGNADTIDPTSSIYRERVAQVISNAFENGLM